MNAEKYANSIIRKIKCSQQKRTEIRKQILSDISIRIQNDETFEMIEESMGTPEEIAEEFNRNLPKSERKIYERSRIIKIVAAIVFILLILAAYAWWVFPKAGEVGSSGNFTVEILEDRVENVILLLDQNDFEALKADACTEMQSVLEQEAIDKARSVIGGDWGERQSIGKVYAQEVRQQGKLYAVTQTAVAYSNVDVIYTISFDEDMKLAGIYIK